MSSIWERTPERRQAADSVSPQDWSLRLQKFRMQNAVLESERDYYKQLYEKAATQKEEIRKKAKEAVKLMKTMYSDYEELQEIVKSKDHTIQSLKGTIKNLEHRLINQSERAKSLVHAGKEKLISDSETVTNIPNREDCSQESSISISTLKSDAPISYVGYMESEEVFTFNPKTQSQSFATPQRYDGRHPHQDQQDSLDLADECATLRARVAELEGFLVGTLYHSATKSTPHKISEKDIEPFTPSRLATSGSAIGRMIEALQQAAAGSVPPTPMDVSRNTATVSEDTAEFTQPKELRSPRI